MEFIEFGVSRGSQVSGENLMWINDGGGGGSTFDCWTFTGRQSVLGRKLAEMHKAGKSEKGFGFDVDNTIGRYIVLD